MKTRLVPLAVALLAALGAVSAAPSGAAAQCQWGCTCLESSCGCNSNGNGRRCDASGSGCAVTGCAPVNIEDARVGRTAELEFTPDGAVVQVVRPERAADPRSLSFASYAPAAAQPEAAPSAQALGGRWEYVAPGRAVARHCSGMVVARYFDHDAAEAARKRSRSLRI